MLSNNIKANQAFGKQSPLQSVSTAYGLCIECLKGEISHITKIVIDKQGKIKDLASRHYANRTEFDRLTAELMVSEQQLRELEADLRELNNGKFLLLLEQSVNGNDLLAELSSAFDRKFLQFCHARTDAAFMSREACLEQARLTLVTARAEAKYFNDLAAKAVDREREMGISPYSERPSHTSNAAIPEARYFNDEAKKKADREDEQRRRRCR